MERYAAEKLLCLNGEDTKTVLVSTIDAYPDRFAIDVAFAFISIVSALENPIVELPHLKDELISELQDCILALVADIYAVEKLSGNRATCRSVRDFWMLSNDTYFPR